MHRLICDFVVRILHKTCILMTWLSILDIAVPRFKHTHKHGETFQTFLRLRCKSRLPILLRSRLSSLPEACWNLLLSCLSWCGIGLGWGDHISALQTVRWFGLRNCFLVGEERKKERKEGRKEGRKEERKEEWKKEGRKEMKKIIF